MEDLFAREQQILNDSASYLETLRGGVPCNAENYSLLVKEYGKLLKQLRRITKISDRTAESLNLTKLDLLDKVNYDAMTGIYNRRFLDENLKQLQTKASHYYGSWFSILMMDIDFFKRYNDTYGHSMGDKCLKVIAKTLYDNVNKSDSFVARYGGEEFIAVLPDTQKAEACQIAARILQGVRDCQIPHKKNEAAEYVTISIGVVSGTMDGLHTAYSFVEQADNALYYSKRTGRNRYHFFTLEENSNGA